METKKLSAMPYAQAHVTIGNGEIQLWSYKTCVAWINREGWLFVNGLYSMTTRRHISAFMREYTPCDFQTAKSLVENHMALNIHTGEVVDR